MASSIARSTARRAVHLRILPRPSNLGESREVYRLISQFGEIEYFKNLKYDAFPHPNVALVIFRDEQAAAKCLHKSPIRFRMGKAADGEHVSDNDGPLSLPASDGTLSDPSPESMVVSSRKPLSSPYGFGQTRTITTESLPDPGNRPIPMPFEPRPATLPESYVFQIETNPARIHFRDQINMGAYHGPFALDSRSIARQDLAKSVPVVGVSCVDWRAEPRPWRLVEKDKEQERSGNGRRKSLSELYDEGPEKSTVVGDEARQD